MTTKELAFATSTIWVVERGGTHGSPTDPLLRIARGTTAATAPAGQSPAPPTAVSARAHIHSPRTDRTEVAG